MACYHPIQAWRSTAGLMESGKWAITFNRKEAYLETEFSIPCGRCIGCRLEHSRQWAIRMVHEASLYDNNSFATLTYSPDKLQYYPSGHSLNKDDIQKFFKRLRKHYGNDKIRYFQCGEYGEKLSRPHHHVCFFGFDFPDKEIFTQIGGHNYYRSEVLDKIWSHGFCLISDFSFETAAYTARYCTKKITGKLAKQHYGGRLPEYITMSRASGIGKEYWQRFKKDIIVGDSIIVRKGLILKPTKYYDSLYDAEKPFEFAKLKQERRKKAELNIEENSYPRLAVKEKLKHKQFKSLKRSYENA